MHFFTGYQTKTAQKIDQNVPLLKKGVNGTAL
jgi:hypothetical protein